MELGNFAHAIPLNFVYDDCEEGNLSKEDFVRAIVKTEYDTRVQVIEAHQSGQFGAPGPDCPPIFTAGIPFEDYIKRERGAKDRADYEAQWEQNCEKSYLKKHSGK